MLGRGHIEHSDFFQQTLKRRAVMRLVEKILHGFGNRLPDAFDGFEFFHRVLFRHRFGECVPG